MDMTSENFGQLDNAVKFARDNGFNFNTEIPSDTLLVIDNPVGVGNDSNKEAIKVQGLVFNNDYTDGVVVLGIGSMQIGSTFIVS